MAGSKLVRTIIGRSLIPLNSLLLFFLVFEPRIVLPGWLQVFGRMHPLALHFPIVLVLIYASLILFLPSRLKKEHWFLSACNTVLLAAAFTASVTALMGFALSRDEGYDNDALSAHKWTGVIIPFLLHLLYSVRDRVLANTRMARTASVGLAVIISVAGHLGATITHGENFILAPLTPANIRVLPAFEDAHVYADMVQPILESKCMGCHNSSKSKGDLIMDTRELFVKGGKNGVPWDTAHADLGLLMSRIHLPPDQKEHMPPKGKPQLDNDEIFILFEWIKRGANFEQKFTDLQPGDTLYAIGKTKLPSGNEDHYDFAAADENTVKKLNSNNRVVMPIATGSPALSATFYNPSQFSIAALKELGPVNNNIVELNLPKMAIKDEDITVVGQFKNLRRLNLNFTAVTGKTLAQLRSLPFLKMISLSGTTVDAADLKPLQDFPKLREVFLWSTPASSSNFDGMSKANKNITWNTGFNGDTVVLQLTPPILENEEEIINDSLELKLKHYIKGTVMRYTLNGKEPDSVASPVFKSGIMLDSNVTVKAKAFKPGWISSEILQYRFYKRKFVPDSINILTKPNPKYAAQKGRSLNDNAKTDPDQNSRIWLGFDKQNFEAMLRFPEPVKAGSVIFRTLNDYGSWIFPARRIEVWGGNAQNNLRLLGTATPKQPDTLQPRSIVPYDIRFTPVSVKYLKLVATPVTRLPAWHKDKGKNGYFFIDEVFVN